MTVGMKERFDLLDMVRYKSVGQSNILPKYLGNCKNCQYTNKFYSPAVLLGNCFYSQQKKKASTKRIH